MQARLRGSVSGRYRADENSLLTKHVVAAGTFAKDAGSTPARSCSASEASNTSLVHSALRVRASSSSALAVADGLQVYWAVVDLASRPKSAAVSLE